ncbi:uncharacterized protein LOC144822045 [Lissotriton helveticus]
MPRQDPDAVFNYFSNEEWKLLHKWQRDLYRNVMKEIHQALMSLGPLITHTVFSLKASEKEEVCFSDNPESPQSDTPVSPKESFHSDTDEKLNIPRSLDGRGRNGHVTTEDKPVTSLLDHPSEEVTESSTDPNSGHDIISFAIKDEEEIQLIDRPDCRRTESAERPSENPAISSPLAQTIKAEEDACLQEQRVPGRRTAGERSRKTKRKYRYSLKSATEETPDIASGQSSTDMFQSSKRGTLNEELPVIKIVSDNAIHSNVRHRTSNVEGSGSYNDDDEDDKSSPKNAKLLQSQKDTLLNSKSYDSMEDVHTFTVQGDDDDQEMYLGEIPCASRNSEKGFNIDVYFKSQNKCEEVGHTVVGAYACNVCAKTFSQKGSLTRHQTIHTGIRYACTECDKSFTRKEMLTVHKRKHTGEKPYQCNDCGKRFSHTGYLFSHKKKHTGIKPYKCTECGKCFSFRANFVIHERSHGIEKPGDDKSSPKNAKLLQSQKDTLLNSKSYDSMEDVPTFTVQGDGDHQEMYPGEITCESRNSEKGFDIDVYFKSQNKCEEVRSHGIEKPGP